MRNSAFTLVEILVCLAIMAIVAGLLTPVFVRAVDSAKVQSSLNKLHQGHLALMLYQSDNGGMLSYGTAADMNLPDFEQFVRTRANLPAEVLRSSCRRDPQISQSSKAFDFRYNPDDTVEAASEAKRFQENYMLLVDEMCDDPGNPPRDYYIAHRMLGVTLGGQLLNIRKPGNYHKPDWWIDPSS